MVSDLDLKQRDKAGERYFCFLQIMFLTAHYVKLRERKQDERPRASQKMKESSKNVTLLPR